jgi:hypothetical protein
MQTIILIQEPIPESVLPRAFEVEIATEDVEDERSPQLIMVGKNVEGAAAANQQSETPGI